MVRCLNLADVISDFVEGLHKFTDSTDLTYL